MWKWALVFSIFILTACQKSEIMTYRVPKQTISIAQLSPPNSAKHLAWTIPESWIEQPSSEFRLASYQVPSKASSYICDFSIVNFPGDAGGVLANVNRWRRQLNLSPIETQYLASVLKPVNHPFLSISYLELYSSNSPKSSSFDSMLVGFFMLADTSYFFKLTGSYSVVKTHADDFIGTLKSIRYDIPQ